jgi:hypothetical protein
MFGQLLAPSQLIGGALLLGAGVAVQIVPARRQARRLSRPDRRRARQVSQPDRASA